MTEMISIIVPTFNEKQNLSPLVKKIDCAMAGRSYEVVIVDDNSPDGTAQEAESLAAGYPVKVVVRTEKKGLAPAVVDGFGVAAGDIIAVMDADLQHPPEALSGLIEEIEKGADIAVASRYVPGSAEEGWTGLRRLMSKGAIFVAHLLLPITRTVADPMSGFFMLRRKVVSNASLAPIGFKILLEILVRGTYRGVAQVPIAFGNRERGSSKLGIGTQLEYVKHVLSLMARSGELTRVAKFCLVGSSGVGVNLCLLWLLTEKAGLFYLASASISIEVAIISNFMLNNFFTFRDRRGKGVRALFMRLLRFNLVSLAGVGVNLGVLWLFTSLLGVYYLLSNCAGIVLATSWNYLVNNWWTWGRRLVNGAPDRGREVVSE